MTEIDIGWQHRYIDTNRIRLHCVTQGEGELVVLLHGFPEFWYSWRYQIPALARHFKVVVPDLRGYNDSDKPASGYDLDTLCEDIRGTIAALGYRSAHIVGHDWGGAIAWHLAHRYPESLNRLAILNAPHPQQYVRDLAGNFDQLRRSWYVFALQIPTLPEWLIRQNLKQFVQNIFRDNAIRKGAFGQEDNRIYQAALAKPGVLNAIVKYYRQLFAPKNWIESWTRSPDPITAPTLVLWGEDDSFLSKTLAQGLDRFTAAPFKLRFISQCGHWIQQEVPQTVNRELLDFLRA
jgi:pimeloyl-ACP methyl ester carboxylesterase